MISGVLHLQRGLCTASVLRGGGHRLGRGIRHHSLHRDEVMGVTSPPNLYDYLSCTTKFPLQGLYHSGIMGNGIHLFLVIGEAHKTPVRLFWDGLVCFFKAPHLSLPKPLLRNISCSFELCQCALSGNAAWQGQCASGLPYICYEPSHLLEGSTFYLK